MTREDAIAKLVECQQYGNPEQAHPKADDILCELLETLGYGDVVAEYQEVIRWFA